MKKIYTCFTAILFLFSLHTGAQNINTAAEEGGEYAISSNDATHPCITPAQYAFVQKQCTDNINKLGLNKSAKNNTLTTSLNWPLKAADGFDDCGFYVITAYVDQNTAATAIQDWNCGSNTYDTHQGTDIAITPYPFYKMDNNQVQVIAAAPGTILYKSDGHFDKNCAGNNDTANYIIIQHSDGSQAHYWHMKKNSVTSKTVGQTVATGEYLGIVGSSGSSSGPHLHFEVWSGNTPNTLNDPFAGTCNTLNANSWWAAQKPYTEPAVIKASVNTTDIVVPNCPTTETPNESDTFAIPFQGAGLNPGYAKFYIFIRNETPSMVATMTILKPDNSTYATWTHNSTTAYKVAYWGYSKLLPTAPGTYTFKAVYNNITCQQNFTITTTTGVNNIENTGGYSIYPNPSKGKFTVELENETTGAGTSSIEVYSVLGAKVFESEITQPKFEFNLNANTGMYFYRILHSNEILGSGKVIVE